MSVVRRESWRRWSLVAAPLVVAELPAGGARVEPAQLRELIVGSADKPYQGYVESVGSLGVPELPNLGDVTSLLNGTTRIRAWYRSQVRWRFDVLSAGGERGVYRTPEGEFVWDYGRNLLTRFVGEPPLRLPRAGDLLPPELARQALRAAPGDPVGALPSRRVAGIEAAGLRLRPVDPDTALAHVDIWADPVRGLPVQVELTAKGATRPVLVSRFLDLTADSPSTDLLTPSLPPDGGLAIATAPDVAAALGAFGRVGMPSRLAGKDMQEVSLAGVRGVGLYGTGLSAFVALSLPRGVGASATDAAGKAGAATVELPGGSGVVLTIPPLSLVVVRATEARRWYLLAGLVEPELLRRAAAELSVLPRSGR